MKWWAIKTPCPAYMAFDQDGGDVSCRWIITEGAMVVLTDSGETLTADLDKKEWELYCSERR